ncbi:hypothetical protein T484DRAFT_1932205 [Baffinella frigidus]|nr:hypothetical protein T484DRAFT_1932205 [Cryptophyta sp. CCMP2293]
MGAGGAVSCCFSTLLSVLSSTYLSVSCPPSPAALLLLLAPEEAPDRMSLMRATIRLSVWSRRLCPICAACSFCFSSTALTSARVDSLCSAMSVTRIFAPLAPPTCRS